MPKFFVGAYAASPCHSSWDPAAEKKYLEALAEESAIAGLELPFFGQLHRWDSEWFSKNLPKHWDHVLTCIPGTMDQLGTDPHFGLASENEEGRKRALGFARAALENVQMLQDTCGRQSVRGVEIHSAPTLGKPGVASSANHFRESLEEILSWDWQGAKILVEHCDRWKKGYEPAKGFLGLEEEIESLRGLNHVGILVNWGRSAIEGRSVDAPAKHITLAARKGALGGLIFSGATINDALYGNWADSHAPFGPPSLLTRDQVERCLQACGSLDAVLLGFKMQALPKALGVEERIGLVRGWSAFFLSCLTQTLLKK
jgi:hypothetical protein